MTSWRRRVVSAVSAIVVTALATSGCMSAGSDDESGGDPAEVRIGLLAPQSGPNRGAGIEAKRGAALAADVINGVNLNVPLPLAEDSGLVNLGNARVRIVDADTKGDTQVAANETTRLAADERVVGLVGAYDPEVTLTASQRAERIPIPFVNGDTSVSFLTERGLDWFFRTGPSVRTAGEAFFSLLKRQELAGAKVGRLVVLHSEDKTGNDAATVIESLAEEGGFEMIQKSYPPGTADLGRVVDSVRSAQPDVVFVAPSPQTVPGLIQAFAQRSYKPDAVMAFGSGFIDAELLKRAGSAVSGLCREGAWSLELAERNEAARAVTSLYRRKYNKQMTEAAASTFTAVLTLAQAVNDAGSTDARQVRTALLGLDVPGEETIMPWEGIRFDETHQNERAASVVEQFVGGAFRVVFPVDTAARGKQFVWPASAAA